MINLYVAFFYNDGVVVCEEEFWSSDEISAYETATEFADFYFDELFVRLSDCE